MNSESFVLGGMVLCPAFLALLALIGGITSLRRAKSSTNSTALNIVGVICVLFALGVGSCYVALLLQ